MAANSIVPYLFCFYDWYDMPRGPNKPNASAVVQWRADGMASATSLWLVPGTWRE